MSDSDFDTEVIVISVGETGLLFTNKKEEEVVEYFNKYNSASFARAGETSEVTVKVCKNPHLNFLKHSLGSCWAIAPIFICD